jgi:hypothetical protein
MKMTTIWRIFVATLTSVMVIAGVCILFGGCASPVDCTIFAGPERELCEAAVEIGEKYSPLPASAIAVRVEATDLESADETEIPED